MDLNTYISKINLCETIIFITAYDDASKYWERFTQKANLGLKVQLSYRESYIAVIDKGNDFVYEAKGYKQLNYVYNLANGKQIQISSCGYQIAPHCSTIIFKEKDYSLNRRGLNIAIYSKESQGFIDCCSVDLFSDEKLNISSSRLQRYFEQVDRVKKGKVLADKYCCYDNDIFYIIINRHLGDSRGALRLFKPIKEYYLNRGSENHSKKFEGENRLSWPKVKQIKKLVAITTESISNFAKLFEGVDDVITINKPEIDYLETYAASGISIHQNIICDVGARKWVQRKNETDEGPWCRSDMYGITEIMWDIVLPQDAYKYAGKIIISDILRIKAKEALYDCIKESVSLSKIVILCPVAQSSSMLNYETWEMYSRVLTQKGYFVLTNLYGNEREIKGTYSFRVGVDIIISLVSMGCHIIGVQSGIMDIVAMLESPLATVLHIIRTNRDKSYAIKYNKEITFERNILHLRIEHFEEDYVLKLLMDNFH